MTLLADVAVIGGGPAGARRRGCSRRGAIPWSCSRAPARQPPLAESLPPSCTKLFEQIGVRAAVDRAGFIRATGNTVQWAGRERRVEMFDRSALGYQVSRDEFDALLLDGAQAAGASVERDATVRDAEREGDVGACRSIGASERTRRTRALGARLQRTRRRDRAARMAASRVGARARRRSRGMWERVGRVADRRRDPHTRRELRDGWAWSVPVSASRRFVTVMLDPRVTTVPGRAQLDAAYARSWRARGAPRARRRRAMVGAPWACDASPLLGGARDRRRRAAGRRRGVVRRSAVVVRRQESAGVGVAGGGRRAHGARRRRRRTAAVELFAERERAMYDHFCRAPRHSRAKRPARTRRRSGPPRRCGAGSRE